MGTLLTALIAVVAVAIVFASAHASLRADSRALAKVGMPLGGGSIDSVTVVSGPHSGRIPAEVRGGQIWPQSLIAAHDSVTVDVVVKRPGWISWLSGGSQHMRLTVRAPSARLREHYLTLASGAPVQLRFQQPIGVIAYGPPGHLQRHVLGSPRTEFTLARTAQAGTVSVAAAPRAWESSTSTQVSWFPAGAQASVVAAPVPGTPIKPDTPIRLTFSKTVQDALGGAKPSLTPATPGTWQTVNSHTIVFKPTGYGYGIGVSVGVALPSGIRLLGAQQNAASTRGAWTVPPGKTMRLQQLLASLGYLPVRFNDSGPAPALTAAAQETAAISPPAGSFSWRYSATPSALRASWQPGSSGTITRGALMAFENDHGLTADGVVGPTVWRALIDARLSGHGSTFGYSFVSVSTSSERLELWHNGHTVLTTPVNTGISATPTATGLYPVYEHIASGTMSGTNPDGSHYNDPGIRYISYFNGGDALHAFTRAQYGSPQSLGCVEMSLAPAGQVFPNTPIGTLVDVG
ncbi:MAG: L,D-transpeptidase family protein [Solirubrobacteraceae bacterium]